MQELIMNFQRKHGKKVPLPKLYMDEDSSDSEGLELVDGIRVGRKATDGAGGSGRGKPGRKPIAGGSSSGAGGSSSGGGNPGPSSGGSGTGGSGSVGGGVGRSGGDDPGLGRKLGRDDDDPDNDPNKMRKTSQPPKSPRQLMARKEPWKGQPMYGGQYRNLVETWLPSMCHVPKRGPSWVSVRWTGPKLNWRRCTRQG